MGHGSKVKIHLVKHTFSAMQCLAMNNLGMERNKLVKTV